MAKKAESADTLLLDKEIEWMKKEINEIKEWQDKILDKIENIVDKFTEALAEQEKENDKKYAKREDVDWLKRAIIWIIALTMGAVITTALSKIGLG